jgi:catechol 2,3-dioxygenase-like lactoylglutathione lyase family enzyme
MPLGPGHLNEADAPSISQPAMNHEVNMRLGRTSSAPLLTPARKQHFPLGSVRSGEAAVTICEARSIPTSTEAGLPDLNGFAHIELTVPDPAVSAAWYQRVLGFRLRGDHRQDGTGVIVLEHTSGMVVGFWHHGGPQRPDRFDEFRTGLDHMSFGVPTRSEIDLWVKHFRALGVDYSEPVEINGVGVIVTFRDPDNVQLEVFWDSRAQPAALGPDRHM